MSNVIVIGAGAAGMMAAITAAQCGDNVTVLEKNEKAGKKLFITGKGRCNITNACDTNDLFANILSNEKFMYSAIYSYDNSFVMDFFDNNGCKTKVERANRVFPVSDKSSDVIRTLTNVMKSEGVKLRLNCQVTSVTKEAEIFKVKFNDERAKNQMLSCDKLIIATGGKSYPQTGSTGDGYKFAKEFGHSVTRLMPALVPFELKGNDFKEVMGLSLKNISLKIKANDKMIYDEFGEMLFTHFGISGPLVLSAGNVVANSVLKGCDKIFIYIDLKPALDENTLDERIQKDFEKNKNKQFKNSLDALLPKSLIPVVIKRSGIDEDKEVNSITKNERNNLVKVIKNLGFEFKDFRGFEEAIITKGGINVKEINPSTMESKLVKGLFFAGEILDVDAKTGGFNLQIAWSSGHLAGSNY